MPWELMKSVADLGKGPGGGGGGQLPLFCVKQQEITEGIKASRASTTRNFVCFAKKSVNAKPFLVRTIFCTYQIFCKRNETSKVPSTSFGGCKNFVRRENPLFLDIHPSLGHPILQHMDYEANVTV